MTRSSDGIRFFRKRKDLAAALFLISLTGSLLMLAAIGLQMGQNQEQTRLEKQIYGEWEGLVSDPDGKARGLLGTHALLEPVGEEVIYGTLVVNPAENALVNGRSKPGETRESYRRGMIRKEESEFLVGWGNKEFQEQEGLQLQHGTWPQAADEVAMEAQVAYRLGMQAYAGEQLTGILNGQTYIFTVTGILDNYTNVWTEGDQQASVFTGAKLAETPQSTLLFVKGTVPGAVSDLKPAVPSLIMNHWAEDVWNPLSESRIPYTLLFIASFLGMILAETLYAAQWLRMHSEGISAMRLLGISCRILQKDFVRLFVRSTGWALGIGLVPALLMRMSAWSLGLWAVACAAAVLIVLEFCLFMIRRLTGTANNLCGRGSQYIPRQSMKDLSPGALAGRFLKVHRFQIGTQTILLSILAGAILFLSLSLAATLVTARTEKQPYDFVVSAGYNETIPVDSLMRLLSAGDADSRTDTWYENYSGWNMELPDRDKLTAMYNLPGQLPDSLPAPDAAQEVRQRISVPVATGHGGQLDLKQVENFQEEVWEPGKGAILVLPAASDWQSGQAPVDADGNIQDPLTAGETVSVYDPDGEKREIVIAGILRSPVLSDTARGREALYLSFGSLLVSPAFVDQEVTSLGLILGDETKKASVRESLSAIAWQSGLNLNNQAGHKQAVLTMLKQRELLEAVLLILVFALILLMCRISGSFMGTILTDYSGSLLETGVFSNQVKTVRKNVTRRLLLMTTGGALTGCLVTLGFQFHRITQQGRVQITGDFSNSTYYLEFNQWLLTRTSQVVGLCIVPLTAAGICILYWLAVRNRQRGKNT